MPEHRLLYLYRRADQIEFLVRADLGETFVDKGDECPGAVWMRLFQLTDCDLRQMYPKAQEWFFHDRR